MGQSPMNPKNREFIPPNHYGHSKDFKYESNTDRTNSVCSGSGFQLKESDVVGCLSVLIDIQTLLLYSGLNADTVNLLEDYECKQSKTE